MRISFSPLHNRLRLSRFSIETWRCCAEVAPRAVVRSAFFWPARALFEMKPAFLQSKTSSCPRSSEKGIILRDDWFKNVKVRSFCGEGGLSRTFCICIFLSSLDTERHISALLLGNKLPLFEGKRVSFLRACDPKSPCFVENTPLNENQNQGTEMEEEKGALFGQLLY